MSTLAMGGGMWAGEKRLFIPSESVTFMLTKSSDGTPYTTGVSAGNLNTAEVLCTVGFPTGATHDLHTNVAAFQLTYATGTSGQYRLALWGEGALNGHDGCLALPGDYCIWIRPVDPAQAYAFNPVFINYLVRSRWQIGLALTSVPGSGNSATLSGALWFYRWEPKVLFDKPLDAIGAANGRTSKITSLQLVISDVNSNLVTISGADFTQGADSHVYFSKAITGLTGARALSAKLTATYQKGDGTNLDTLSQSWLVEAPAAA